MFTEVIKITNRAETDIECPTAEHGYVFGSFEYPKKTGAYGHWVLRSLAIKSGEFGILPVATHIPIYLMKYRQHVLRNCIGGTPVSKPELQLHGRCHGGICIPKPLGIRRHRQQQTKQDKRRGKRARQPANLDEQQSSDRHYRSDSPCSWLSTACLRLTPQR